MSVGILQQILNEIKDTKKEQQGMKKDISEIKQCEINFEKINIISKEQRQIKQATIDSGEVILSLKDDQESQDKTLEPLDHALLRTRNRHTRF